jgi:hypothetical protein
VFRAYNQASTIVGVESGGGELSKMLNYPVTVRLTNFQVPDVEAQVYQIKYHGIQIDVPTTEITLDRSVDLEFREDAAFRLR